MKYILVSLVISWHPTDPDNIKYYPGVSKPVSHQECLDYKYNVVNYFGKMYESEEFITHLVQCMELPNESPVKRKPNA